MMWDSWEEFGSGLLETFAWCWTGVPSVFGFRSVCLPSAGSSPGCHQLARWKQPCRYSFITFSCSCNYRSVSESNGYENNKGCGDTDQGFNCRLMIFTLRHSPFSLSDVGKSAWISGSPRPPHRPVSPLALVTLTPAQMEAYQRLEPWMSSSGLRLGGTPAPRVSNT